MIKRKMIAIIMMLTMLLSVIPFTHPAKADGAKWTVMIYMTGSDLETDGASATIDLTEMLRSGMDVEQVQVIVAAGGAKSWHSAISGETISYYRIRGEEPELIQETELASMGEAATLSSFLNTAYQAFPAEHYALVLWDHGGGPMEGVCYDELFPDENGKKDPLTLEELSAALSDSPFSEENQLSFIGFDACMMSSVETAAICSPYAKYMIASEETEPENGWNYSFLNGMEADEDGEDTGRRIIDSYFEGIEEETEENTEDRRTLALVSLSGISNLEESTDHLFSYLDTYIDQTTFSQLSNIRRDAQSFGRSTTGCEYDLVDFSSLAARYPDTGEEDVQQVLDAISNAVIYMRSSLDDTCGLSIYYPFYNKDYFQNVWRERYAKTGFSAGYRSYLEHYASLWLGEPMASFEGLQPQVSYNEENHTAEITLELTPSQQENYSDAALVVSTREFFTDETSDEVYSEYSKIWETDDIQYEDGILSAEYDFAALCLEYEEGGATSLPITYYIVDGSYFIHVILIPNAESGSELYGEAYAAWEQENMQHAWLRCELDETTGELTIKSVIYIDDPEQEKHALYTGKQETTLDPEEWANIRFLTEHTDSPDYGWPMHGDDKEYSVTVTGDISNGRPWKLAFCNDVLFDSNLNVQYMIQDTQASTTGSEKVYVNSLGGDDQRIYIDYIGYIDYYEEPAYTTYTVVPDENGVISLDGLPEGPIIISGHDETGNWWGGEYYHDNVISNYFTKDGVYNSPGNVFRIVTDGKPYTGIPGVTLAIEKSYSVITPGMTIERYIVVTDENGYFTFDINLDGAFLTDLPTGETAVLVHMGDWWRIEGEDGITDEQIMNGYSWDFPVN